mmetsp:Transcript_8946/g.22134  ORF Transcript_8946/g.22134 Transcript_8946/m.22134 type:complete len:224 (-) Transcript_8946:1518-2189(-)
MVLSVKDLFLLRAIGNFSCGSFFALIEWIESVQPLAKALQTFFAILCHVKGLQDFHAVHNSHALDAFCIISSQQHCQSNQRILGEIHFLGGVLGMIDLHILFVVENVFVHDLPSKDKGIAILRDDSVDQAQSFQLHALCLGFGGCYHVRNSKQAQKLHDLGSHLLRDAFGTIQQSIRRIRFLRCHRIIFCIGGVNCFKPTRIVCVLSSFLFPGRYACLRYSLW